MSQSSPFLNRWLSTIGPDAALAGLAELMNCGAVFVIDSELRILFWSRGAERLLGIAGDQVLGQPCQTAIRSRSGAALCSIAEQGIVS